MTQSKGSKFVTFALDVLAVLACIVIGAVMLFVIMLMTSGPTITPM